MNMGPYCMSCSRQAACRSTFWSNLLTWRIPELDNIESSRPGRRTKLPSFLPSAYDHDSKKSVGLSRTRTSPERVGCAICFWLFLCSVTGQCVNIFLLRCSFIGSPLSFLQALGKEVSPDVPTMRTTVNRESRQRY